MSVGTIKSVLILLMYGANMKFEALCLRDDIKKIFSNLLLILSVLFSYFDGMICRLMQRK